MTGGSQAARGKRPGGWILPGLLLGVYVALKLQGWFYAQRVQELQRELDGLRPLLSEKVYSEHLQQAALAHQEAIRRIRQMRWDPAPLLIGLSERLPASVTIDELEIRTNTGIRIRGSFLPGIRPVESVVIPWAERMQGALAALRPSGKSADLKLNLRELAPSAQRPGLWEFHLQAGFPPAAGESEDHA